MTTSPKTSEKLVPNELVETGAARARDIIFDAVHDLWQIRSEQGVKQTELAAALGKNPSWVCRSLAGPGNWTLETFGALAEALNGHIDVRLIPREHLRQSNYDFYADRIDGIGHTFCPVSATPFRSISEVFGSTATLTVGDADTQTSGDSQSIAGTACDV